MVKKEILDRERCHRFQPGQPGAGRWQWARTPWTLLVLLLVGVLAVRHLYLWSISPERRIAQFLAAARRDDPVGMLSLADQAEVERLRLTPEKLRAVLKDAAGSPGGMVPGSPRPVPLGKPQRGYNRMVIVPLLGRDGRSLPGAMGRTADVIVVAYRTKTGWKIGISNFIYSVLVSRMGSAMREGYYARLLARHSVAPELYQPEDDTWVRVPGAEEQHR